MTGRWVKPTPEAADAPLRLFCFPHAGGGGAFFRAWRDRLRPRVEVCPVVLPGREFRIDETPYRRMEDLIGPLCDGLRPHLGRPYALFGHSMGALVAYEVARRFTAEGRAPVRLVVSGRRAPHVAALRRPLADIPDDDLVTAVSRLGGTPDVLLEERGLWRLLLPCLRADFAVDEGYRPADGPRLGCPVSAFTGDRDPEVEPAQADLWRVTTDGGFRLHVHPGDHFYLTGLPDAVRDDLVADLGGDHAWHSASKP
ncbi:alpha/beta fold hydrolase [Actinosynnema sp. NPDC050801]|uniref:thioesterase II family protein n=1 Tax=unclassified Actinosynnema TaxID=2637065 RepID=UPI0033EC61A5